MAIGSVLDEALQLWRELVETFVLVKMRRDRHLKLEGLLERSRGVRPRRISAEVVVCEFQRRIKSCVQPHAQPLLRDRRQPWPPEH